MSRPTIEEYRRFRAKVLEPVELPPDEPYCGVTVSRMVDFGTIRISKEEARRIAWEKWKRRI